MPKKKTLVKPVVEVVPYLDDIMKKNGASVKIAGIWVCMKGIVALSEDEKGNLIVHTETMPEIVVTELQTDIAQRIGQYWRNNA